MACRGGHIEDGRKPCTLACRQTAAKLHNLHCGCRPGPHLGAPSSLRRRVRDVPKFPLLAAASEHTRIVHAVAYASLMKQMLNLQPCGVLSIITFAAPKSPAFQPLAAVKLQLSRSDRCHRCGYTSIQDLVRTIAARLIDEVWQLASMLVLSFHDPFRCLPCSWC